MSRSRGASRQPESLTLSRTSSGAPHVIQLVVPGWFCARHHPHWIASTARKHSSSGRDFAAKRRLRPSTGIVSDMALFSREFIAVPDDRKGQIVFKWPDVTIRRFTHAIVNADEVAMFVNTGQIAATMGPGRHSIDADEIPGLGAIIDFATGGNAYRAELYFVGTREYTGFKFGGRVDDVQDPRTGLVVTLRVFGDYALRVIDPARLITNLTATVDVTDNERIAGWVSDQLLKVLRTNVTTQVVANGWPILGLSVHSPEIEQAAITAGNGQLEAYGIAVTRMGNFDINLSPGGRRAAQAARQGHLVLPARGRLRAVRGGRDGARRRTGHGPGRRLDRGRVPRGRHRARRRPRRARAAAAAAGTAPAARPAGPGAAAAAPAPAPAGRRVRRPATRRTRPAPSSAWAAARRWRRRSSTAPSAGPSCPGRRSSAPTAAPRPAADGRSRSGGSYPGHLQKALPFGGGRDNDVRHDH